MKNLRHRKFIEEYSAHCNGTLAAINSGYKASNAKQTAYELLQDEAIRKAIDERMDALSIQRAEITKRLSDMARGNFSPFLQLSKDASGMRIELDLTTPEAEANLHLIRKIKQTRVVLPARGEEQEPTIELRTEIELHDAKDALVQMARIRGLFVDKVEHSGNIPAPIVFMTPYDPGNDVNSDKTAG